MTNVTGGWAAWAVRALTTNGRDRRRPMPRVRLGCEVMEGRSVPATMLYTGTETWTGTGGDLIVTSTVTEDAPGYTGKLLWQYHVVNDSFEPNAPVTDGMSFFAVPVDDPTTVADISTLPGWASSAGASALVGGGNAVAWNGGVDKGHYLAKGDSADFSFTTPNTAPIATNVGGSGYNDGIVASADGLCAAPVAGVPSIKFTADPAIGPNAGDIKFSFRYDNLPANAAKVSIEVRNANNFNILMGSTNINVTKASGKEIDVIVACGLLNSNKSAVVCLTVVNANGVPLNPGISAQEYGNTK